MATSRHIVRTYRQPSHRTTTLDGAQHSLAPLAIAADAVAVAALVGVYTVIVGDPKQGARMMY